MMNRGKPVLAGAAAALVIAVAVPNLVGGYWLFSIIAGVVSIILMQSLGVLMGRMGVLALCQMSFAGVGAWVVQWCNVHALPGGFFVWLILGALAAIPVGLLVGLTALRLRGATLAVATFSVATASDVIWGSGQFPGQATAQMVARPGLVFSDTAYFQFVVVLAVAIFVVLVAIDRTRLGSAWVEVRYSERAATAHGIGVAITKLSAFGLSSFLAGLAGGLMVGQLGSVNAASFTAVDSTAVFALAVMLGVHNIEAAVLAGLTYSLLPALLAQIHVSGDIATIAFGLLAVFALKAGRGQLGQSDVMRAKRRARRAAVAQAQATATAAVQRPKRGGRPVPAPSVGIPALAVSELTVRFGGVTAVENMRLVVPPKTIVALVGPNGAGKSTLINAITGFAQAEAGRILVNGHDLAKLSPQQRARRGVRRSFQQLQVPPALTAGMFLRSAAGRRMTEEEVREYLDWFGCPPAHVHVGAMDVGRRRILEVAGLAASKASVLLLDEPAAGQAAMDSQRLADAIAQIPERTGSSVVLVEHDMDLIRDTCDSIVVMDAGRLLAEGAPSEVLGRPDVVEAYVGPALALAQ